MRWIALFVLGFCLGSVFGCAPARADRQTPDDDGSTTTITTDPPQPLTCDGLCVDTPPATYTGPSLFWLGLPSLVPDCPAETPYQGLEGYVSGPMLPLFARECRTSPMMASVLPSSEPNSCRTV